MQDCRTDCGCSRKCLGYPRQALCLARARYCITPHRNFDGLASLPASPPAWKGEGLDGRLFGCVGRRWPSSVVPGWFPGSTPPCAWFWFRSQVLGPRAGAGTIAEDSGGGRQPEEKERGGGRKEGEERRGELVVLPRYVPCHAMLCCVVLVLCRCYQR